MVRQSWQAENIIDWPITVYRRQCIIGIDVITHYPCCWNRGEFKPSEESSDK